MPAFFISGIDTGIGKTIITGLIAKYLINNKKNVITQKLVQTGCTGISEDILLHRKIMDLELTKEDKDGITCPYIFDFPASPHLAANLEGQEIDTTKIKTATDKLLEKYEYVLIEGAGGLLVPLKLGYTTIDYIHENKLPLIFVSSPKLGSINHTLLSLEAARKRDIEVKGIVYNLFPSEINFIARDSKEVFEYYLKKFDYPQVVVDVSFIKKDSFPDIDFSELFN